MHILKGLLHVMYEVQLSQSREQEPYRGSFYKSKVIYIFNISQLTWTTSPNNRFILTKHACMQ